MSQTKAALIHTFLCVLLSFLHHYVESQRRPHPCSRRRLRMCPSTERRLLAWYGKASRVERVKGLRARTERRVLGSVSPIETVPRKLKECARCWVKSGSLFKYLDCRFTTPCGPHFLGRPRPSFYRASAHRAVLTTLISRVSRRHQAPLSAETAEIPGAARTSRRIPRTRW